MNNCGLCPRGCGLEKGGTGFCRTRAASFGASGRPPRPAIGTVDSLYGLVTAAAVDPIEKKPLYHWRPGSSVFSAGFAGCNMRCPFCQNWHISQNAGAPGRRISPQALVDEAAESLCGQIAYTYSEPLVHFEYLLDCMEKARAAGIANILVSNGCVNRGPASEILALTDAANIDLKSFSAETYAKTLGGDLDTVLNFIRAAAAPGIHLEITTLVVPGLNDSEEELDAAAAFIAGLFPAPENGSSAETGNPAGARVFGVPWHLSAYHPDWKWDAPPTKPGALFQIARRARDRHPRLRDFIYIGNSPVSRTEQAVEFWDTVCPACGAVLVRRAGGFRPYTSSVSALEIRDTPGGPRYYCAACGKAAPISGARAAGLRAKT
ncbi:MAG: radical SAM protein [Treponema sp.]|nr:radical SAM protein [Treponema sp.]